MVALFERLQAKEQQTPAGSQQKCAKRPQSTALSSNGSLRAPSSRKSLISGALNGTKLRPSSMIGPPSSNNRPLPETRRGSSPLPNLPGDCDKTPHNIIKVSFVEIYNEELVDLLNPAPPSERPPVTIREDTKGHIYWTGVKEVTVQSTEDVLR